jgi:hypothetical protein
VSYELQAPTDEAQTDEVQTDEARARAEVGRIATGRWNAIRAGLRIRVVPTQLAKSSLTRPVGSGLTAEVVIDTNAAVLLPSPAMVDRWGRPAVEPWAEALKNAERVAPPPATSSACSDAVICGGVPFTSGMALTAHRTLRRAGVDEATAARFTHLTVVADDLVVVGHEATVLSLAERWKAATPRPFPPNLVSIAASRLGTGTGRRADRPGSDQTSQGRSLQI